MNGRLYDAKLHRFLQPDNYIQDPYNTQNYNRYGYVLNNPLKYTDPSGEEILIGTAILIGAIVGATTYTITALLTTAPFSLGGFLKASFFGGLSGAVTFGIGSAVQSLPIAEKIVAGAFMHGTSQAAMTGVQGGDPLSAFVSGALSSIAAGLWSTGGVEGKWQGVGGAWAKSDFGTIAFGTFAGGAGAQLSGGNFWQGAVTGLTVGLLNHSCHKGNSFNEEIDDYYGSKADKPVFDMSQSDVDGAIKNIPTLKRIFTKLIKKFSSLEVNYVNRFGADDGKTFFNISNKKVSSISIYRSAGATNRYMAQTILHEFGHAMSGYHGFFFSNYKKYGEYSSMPVALDEIYAHKFAFHHGGVKYNTPYYNSNFNFIKESSYKIDPNSLVLPSFN